LRELLERLPDLAGLEMRGLMMVPPFLEDLAAGSALFSRVCGVLRDRLAAVRGASAASFGDVVDGNVA